MFSKLLTTAAFFAMAVSAHMEMTVPAPLGSQHNKATPQGSINYNLKSPVSAANFPCNVASFDSLVSGPGGAPSATWAAGSSQSFTISGGASHNGGSCQASLSEDGGKTWIVIGSVVGGCPVDGKAFPFTVPKSAKSGKAIFAWTWFNKTGNREMYMNCAAVDITGGGSGLTGQQMFVANVPGKSTCETAEGRDIEFDYTKDCKTGGAPAGGDGTGESTTPTEPEPAPPSSSAPPSPTTTAAPSPTTTVPVAQPSTGTGAPAPGGFDDGMWYEGKYPGGRKTKRMHWAAKKRRNVIGGVL